jgi:hypothetical protein
MSEAKFTVLTSSSDQIAKTPEIAIIEFGAVKRLRGLPSATRRKNIRSILNRAAPMALAAGELIVMEKRELITRVANEYDVFGPLLMQLAEAQDELAILKGLIGAAEARLAIALANVEGEKPPVPIE